MAQNWDSHVNQKLYGLGGGYNDNIEKVDFKSGRVVYYKKNSLPKKKYSLSLDVNDSMKDNGKTEFEWFLHWYETTLASGTQHFYLTDITTHLGTREYRFTTEPTWSGQKTKTLSLEFEEV